MTCDHTRIFCKCGTITKLLKEAVANIQKEQIKWNERYDSKISKFVTCSVGEVVFLHCPPIHMGEPTRLQSKFRGPLMVTKILPNAEY